VITSSNLVALGEWRSQSAEIIVSPHHLSTHSPSSLIHSLPSCPRLAAFVLSSLPTPLPPPPYHPPHHLSTHLFTGVVRYTPYPHTPYPHTPYPHTPYPHAPYPHTPYPHTLTIPHIATHCHRNNTLDFADYPNSALADSGCNPLGDPGRMKTYLNRWVG
jgi:hypothetical protein